MFTQKFCSVAVLVLLAAALLCGGCGTNTAHNPSAETSPTQSTPSAPPLTGFARDLEFVRNGQFTYIWVFSRKDGQPLNKEDGAYLRKNAPQVVDWVMTDEGKRAIAGANFALEQGNLDLLRKRFLVEDYSGR